MATLILDCPRRGILGGVKVDGKRVIPDRVPYETVPPFLFFTQASPSDYLSHLAHDQRVDRIEHRIGSGILGTGGSGYIGHDCVRQCSTNPDYPFLSLATGNKAINIQRMNTTPL